VFGTEGSTSPDVTRKSIYHSDWLNTTIQHRLLKMKSSKMKQNTKSRGKRFVPIIQFVSSKVQNRVIPNKYVHVVVIYGTDHNAFW
jgi:hypothetical protein